MKSETEVKALLKEVKGFEKKTCLRIIEYAKENNLNGIEEEFLALKFFDGMRMSLESVLNE